MRTGSVSNSLTRSGTLNYLGVVIGVAGILTIVTGLDVALPALDVPETVFVLVIVWFVWLGIIMSPASSFALRLARGPQAVR